MTFLVSPLKEDVATMAETTTTDAKMTLIAAAIAAVVSILNLGISSWANFYVNQDSLSEERFRQQIQIESDRAQERRKAYVDFLGATYRFSIARNRLHADREIEKNTKSAVRDFDLALDALWGAASSVTALGSCQVRLYGERLMFHWGGGDPFIPAEAGETPSDAQSRDARDTTNTINNIVAAIHREVDGPSTELPPPVEHLKYEKSQRDGEPLWPSKCIPSSSPAS